MAKTAKVSREDLFSTLTDDELGELAESREQKFLEIEGEAEPVAFFDWFALEAAEAEDESNSANEIREYHISDAAAVHVEADEWVPFGIVGLTGRLTNYEETGADGTLFIDLTRVTDDDAVVVFVPNDTVTSRLTKNTKPRKLEDSYRELMETLSDA